MPPPSPRKHWTRRGIAEWLGETLSEGPPAIAGIDHGFSFPLAYFEKYRLSSDWAAFLDDFRRHWPTDEENMYVDFVREGVDGAGHARRGDSHWRRLTEIRARAKSVFHFDAPGSVAKSTHAGLPWLLYLCRRAAGRVHFWPFDGWDVPAGRSVVCEAYPSLWKRQFPREDRNDHQQDAYSIAAWLRQADSSGELTRFFHPQLNAEELGIAKIEGWILGVS